MGGNIDSGKDRQEDTILCAEFQTGKQGLYKVSHYENLPLGKM